MKINTYWIWPRSKATASQISYQNLSVLQSFYVLTWEKVFTYHSQYFPAEHAQRGQMSLWSVKLLCCAGLRLRGKLLLVVENPETDFEHEKQRLWDWVREICLSGMSTPGCIQHHHLTGLCLFSPTEILLFCILACVHRWLCSIRDFAHYSSNCLCCLQVTINGLFLSMPWDNFSQILCAFVLWDFLFMDVF